MHVVFRQVSLELQKETERRQTEEEAWYRQQKLLLDAEDKRRKLIADEETKLVDQRARYLDMSVFLCVLIVAEGQGNLPKNTAGVQRAVLNCRLAAMQRELKMKELQLLDATRRKFLLYQQQQKESELNRLDDEIRRKVHKKKLNSRFVRICYFLKTSKNSECISGCDERLGHNHCGRRSKHQKHGAAVAEKNV